jgi:hypothetical protein
MCNPTILHYLQLHLAPVTLIQYPMTSFYSFLQHAQHSYILLAHILSNHPYPISILISFCI